MCMLQSLCRLNNSRCLAMFVTIKVAFKYGGHTNQGKIKVIVSGQGNVKFLSLLKCNIQPLVEVKIILWMQP